VKLGKQAATYLDSDLRLSSYLTKLPPIPPKFGKTDAFADWGMLGNDSVGDCAFAGPAHETMLWTLEGGKPASFTTAGVLSDYSAVTGYDPNDPSTDQGSNVHDVARYRKATGLIDGHGHRHKIAAYLSIDHRNMAHIVAAAYLFDAVGLGILVPASAQEQFAAGEPWTVVPGSPIEGGHYVPLIGVDPHWLYVVTWGKVQRMSRNFYVNFGDEAWAYLSTEFLKAGKSPDGFDLAQLQADLGAVG